MSFAAVTAAAAIGKTTSVTGMGIVNERRATMTETATGIMTRSLAMTGLEGREMIGISAQVAIAITATVESGNIENIKNIENIEGTESTETNVLPMTKGTLITVLRTEKPKKQAVTATGVMKVPGATNSATIIMTHRWFFSIRPTRINETNTKTSTEKLWETAMKPCLRSTHAAILSYGSLDPTTRAVCHLTTVTGVAALS